MPLIACWECGRQISDKATACPACGAPPKVPEPEPARLSFICPNCDAPLAATAVACAKCKAEFEMANGWRPVPVQIGPEDRFRDAKGPALPTEVHPNAKQAAKSFKPQKDLTTVAGWLLILVIALTVLGPLRNIGEALNEIQKAEKEFPSLVSLPAWGTYKTWSWAAILASVAMSVIAGWRLGTTREPSAVSFAKWTLWLTGPVAVVFVGALLPKLVFGAYAVDDQFFSLFIVSIIAATIWTLYLSKSERVRQRYTAPGKLPI